MQPVLYVSVLSELCQRPTNLVCRLFTPAYGKQSTAAPIPCLTGTSLRCVLWCQGSGVSQLPSRLSMELWMASLTGAPLTAILPLRNLLQVQEQFSNASDICKCHACLYCACCCQHGDVPVAPVTSTHYLAGAKIWSKKKIRSLLRSLWASEILPFCTSCSPLEIRYIADKECCMSLCAS